MNEHEREEDKGVHMRLTPTTREELDELVVRLNRDPECARMGRVKRPAAIRWAIGRALAILRSAAGSR